jgi:predicted DNA-binding transcriptional regulator AlpA
MSKLLRFPEVEARVRLKRTAIYRLIKAAKFPAPVKQGGASFWFDDEIEDYLEHLKSERPASRTTPASS